jgi:hypothetical protein
MKPVPKKSNTPGRIPMAKADIVGFARILFSSPLVSIETGRAVFDK